MPLEKLKALYGLILGVSTTTYAATAKTMMESSEPFLRFVALLLGIALTCTSLYKFIREEIRKKRNRDN